MRFTPKQFVFVSYIMSVIDTWSHSLHVANLPPRLQLYRTVKCCCIVSNRDGLDQIWKGNNFFPLIENFILEMDTKIYPYNINIFILSVDVVRSEYK